MKKLLILLGFLIWIPAQGFIIPAEILGVPVETVSSPQTDYSILQPLGSGFSGQATLIGTYVKQITSSGCPPYQFGNMIFNLYVFSSEEDFNDFLEDGDTNHAVFNYEIEPWGDVIGCGPSGDRFIYSEVNSETIWSHVWNPEWYYAFSLRMIGSANEAEWEVWGLDAPTWNGYNCAMGVPNFASCTGLTDFGGVLNIGIDGVTSSYVPPPEGATEILNMIEPTGILPTASTTVDFEFTYYNGIPLVSFAFAEVRDLTNQISYATELIAPLANGENTYEDSLVLEAGAFHMWRPILDFGTSTPRIYGSWTTFDVLTPSAGFTPDPVFWGNTDPWNTNASSTAGLSETTCQGISNPIILASCHVVAFLFVPPPFAYQFIEKLVLQFYSTFPFNLLALGIDTAWSIQQFDWTNYHGTTTLFTLTFSNATSTAQMGDINLVSSETIQNAIPNTVANLIRNTLTIGIYVMFVMSITFSARKVFNQKT